MSRIGVFTNPDRFKGEMINVSFDEDGNVSLTLDNLIPWGDLTKVTARGHPEKGVLLEPTSATGWNVYAGLDPGSIVRQNNSPLSLTLRHVFQLPTISEEGDPPPTEEEATFPDVAPEPVLEVKDNTLSGFKNGTYKIKLSGVDEGGRHTLLSPMNQVSISNRSANWINFTIPEFARDYAGLGVWMPYQGKNTYYLLEVIDLTSNFPSEYALAGPFVALRREPDVNETYLGETDAPNVTEGVPSAFNLTPGVYNLYATLVTRSGEALPNTTPTTVTVEDLRIKNGLQVTPSSQPEGVVGWFCYAELSDGRTYLVYPSNSTPERPLLIDERAMVYSVDPGGWTGLDWSVYQKDLPSAVDGEDNSGLPAPDTAPYGLSADAPSAKELSGETVYVQLSLTQDDLEGPRGPMAAIGPISGTNKMVSVLAPKVTQLAPNPQGLETDPDGLPLQHRVRQSPTVNGLVTPEEAEVTIQTTTSTNNEAASDAIQATYFDKTDDHTIVGEIEITQRVSGRAQLCLVEYASTAPIYGQTTALKITVMKELKGVGVREVDYAIPPTFWQPATASYLVVARITDGNGVSGSGAARSLTMIYRNLAIFSSEHVPRRWVDSLRGRRDLSDGEAPPIVPYAEGAKARIGYPPVPRKPPELEEWNGVKRPLQVGSIEQELTFASGIPAPFNLVRNLGGISTTNPGTLVAIDVNAAIEGTAGLHLKDTTVSQQAQLGVGATITTLPRHRMGVGMSIKEVSATIASGRDLLEIESSDGTPLCSASQDASRSVRLKYYDGGVYYIHKIFGPSPFLTRINLDLTVSGAGTKKAIVSLWGSIGNETRILLARFERLDMEGLQAQRVFGGVREYNPGDMHETYIDLLRVSDGGAAWYRDHNADGELLGQAHLFMPKHHKKTHRAFLTDIELAVKPGQRYGFGVFFDHKGVKGRAHPLDMKLHRNNGETVHLGSMLGNGAGISGTGEYKEHLRDITIPAYSASDLGQNVFKMTITSRDIEPGTYIAQELGGSELNPTEPLRVKRTGLRRQTGTYRVTLFTGTPGRGSLGPRLPRRWIRAVTDLVSAPSDTTEFEVQYRVTNDEIAYTLPVTDFSLVTPRAYLEFEMVFAGDGRSSPVLGPKSPMLETRFYDSVLLNEDGSELSGGALVTGFSMTYDDPQYDIREQASGHFYRQQVAPDIPWLDPFNVTFFTKEALNDFRNRWAKDLFLIENEASGELVKIMILDKPDIEVRADTIYLESTGEIYNAYAIASVDECEVIEATTPPGL